MVERGAWSFKLGLQDASPRKGHCCWCFTTAYITCDGFVTPCCIRTDPRVKQFGNLREETFEAVWNNDAMREFRRSHLRGGANPVCDRCPD
jgi:radical SAM protein with 4Fe4S-binding SPASM domain